jgi:hypothetical protein
MGDILRSPSGTCVVMTPRSGSHSLAAAALAAWHPERYAAYLAADATWHPAAFLPEENYDGTQPAGIIVRNPVERFRSMCSHRPDRNVDEHLSAHSYGPLPAGPFARVFRFEDGLDAVAEYLGLPVPLPQLDATDEADKPQLTTEQEARVREIYAADLALWESLSQ